MPSMKQIDTILDNIVKREGGYVNDPRDPGGETKYGISKRAHPQVDIKNLTIPQAKDIYFDEYVLPHGIHRINDPHIAELLLDWIVNSGPQKPVKAIQQIVNVDVDGVMGPHTVEAINTYPAGDLAHRLLHERLFFLCTLTKHPFILGWVHRLVELGL